MRQCLLLVAAAAASPSGAIAQGVQPMSGSYVVAILASSFGGPGACCPGMNVELKQLGLAFAPNGTFQSTGSVETIVCSQFVTCPSTEPPETGLAYTTDADGSVLLDFDPSNPGTDTARLFVRSDAGVMIHTPESVVDEAVLAIAVRLSSGLSNASLNGAYHWTTYVLDFGTSNPPALAGRSGTGVVTFDGAGGLAGSVTTRTVTALGVTTTTGPNAIAGTYTVAADGRFTHGALAGAIAPDGEFVFAAGHVGGSVVLEVGVRRGTGLDSRDFDGPWTVVEQQAEFGGGSPVGADWLGAGVARVQLASLTPGGSGTILGSQFYLELDRGAAPTGGTAPISGGYALAPDGAVSLLPPGQPSLPAALSANGTFLIGTMLDPASVGILVGLRRTLWPASFGVGLAGTGGLVPVLAATGGYPYAGNAAFAVRIANARGGAAALVGLSFFQTPGVPVLGGTFYLPFGALLSFFVPLGGAAGAPGAGTAALSMPLPPVPDLLGVFVHAQALVADPAAVQGVAFTAGLQIVVGR